MGRLFLSFLKIGSVVFGSGYVLLAFLQSEFVEHLHWLSEQQLLDAVAVGQFTPGPVFTTATFIGYIVAGWAGAVVATVGIFLPGFILVALSGPVIPRLRRSPIAAAALDGVVAGSLALMAVVTWQLGKASIVSWTTLAIFGAGFNRVAAVSPEFGVADCGGCSLRTGDEVTKGRMNGNNMLAEFDVSEGIE